MSNMSTINMRFKEFFKEYGAITIVCMFLLVLIALSMFTSINIPSENITISISNFLWIIACVCSLFFIGWLLSLVIQKVGPSYDTGIFSMTSFRYGLIWMLPLLGVLGYGIVFADLLSGKSKEIVIEISSLLVVGGVVGFLSNSAHFFGIFKSELKSIIYSDEFLGNRKDVAKIWRKVSKSMIESKFPNISEDLFTVIEDHYISKNEYSYYSDYRIAMDVSWSDESREAIIIKDYVHFDLVTEKKGNVELSFSAWISTTPNQVKGEHYYCRCDECKVNNDRYDPIETEDEKENNYKKTHVINIDNPSTEPAQSNSYHIAIVRERKVSLESDYHLSFRAKYIIKDMNISITLPDGLDATFICRGTPKDFITVKNDKNSQEFLYKGLVLQRQGFTFALFKNGTSHQ